jgi:type II secretory pathway component PulJ
LELLVAIVIAGLIAALVGGSLRLGSRSWETVQSMADEEGEIALVQSLLRRLLERSYPLAERTGAGRPVAFSGDAEGLRFLATAPAQIGASGLLQWRLTAGGGALSLDWRGTGDAADRTRGQHLLLSGIAGMEASFYGSRDRQERETWHDRWVDAPFQPSLIRLRLRFADPRRFWPDLLVAPAITVDALLD